MSEFLPEPAGPPYRERYDIAYYREEHPQHYLEAVQNPVEVHQLARTAGFVGLMRSTSPGMTDIVDDPIYAQYLPNFPLKAFIGREELKGELHNAVSGRVAQIKYQTNRAQGAEEGDKKAIFIADARTVNGDVWMKSEEENNPLLGFVKNAYAVFAFDKDAPNTAHSMDPRFKDNRTLESGDWVLANVLTDNDANTIDGSFYPLTKGHGPLLLSEKADTRTLEMFGDSEGKREQGVKMAKALIDAFHHRYHERGKPDSVGDMATQLAEEFEDCSIYGPEFMAVPLRAFEAQAYAQAALEQGRISQSVYDARVKIIREEVWQAMMMAEFRKKGGFHVNTNAALLNESVKNNDELNQALAADPVRWIMQLHDKMTKNFEEGLFSNFHNAGDLTESMARYIKRIQRLPKETVLSVIPTAGNNVRYAYQMFGDLDGSGPFGRSPNDGMVFAAPYNYYFENVASLYQYHVRSKDAASDEPPNLKMDGMVARLEEIIPPELGRSRRLLIVDLRRAPAQIVRAIADYGFFGKAVDTSPDRAIRASKTNKANKSTDAPLPAKTLSAMLLHPRPSELIFGTREAVRGNETGVIEVLGKIGVGQVAQVIGSYEIVNDKRVVNDVRIEIVEEKAEPDRKPKKMGFGRKSQELVVTATPHQNNERVIGKIGLLNGGLQAWGVKDKANSVQIEVMRNAGPVQRKN